MNCVEIWSSRRWYVARKRYVTFVKNILIKKYGFSSEAADNVTQTYLRSFRKCPENSEFLLHDWRRLLWEQSLGDFYSGISGDIYYQWLTLRYQCIAPSTEVISLIKNLRKNYYLALITNGPSNSQWEKIKRLQLDKYFDLILVSGDLKWEKPNKKIFLEACHYFGVNAKECVMVGDKFETDIVGAIQAGLGGTIWVLPPGSVIESNSTNIKENRMEEIVPLCTINDVTTLPRLLPS